MSRLEDAARQARSLGTTEHRPWPLPEGPWVMGQTWVDLLFLHWRVPRDELRPHVPDVLELEEFDGSAWIGLTPFRVAGLRLRGLPPLPLLSSFLELNCRTYVRCGDRPGIWFFSLDASSRTAVAAARRTYRLPYRFARASAGPGRFEFRRRGIAFEVDFRLGGELGLAAAGTLEAFLVERYRLYGGDGDVAADIHHAPWSLRRAEAVVEASSLPPVSPNGEPVVHYSARQDVVVWPPVSGNGAGAPARPAHGGVSR